MVMAYEQKDGQGILFINKYKKEEKHPDFTGNITFAGVQYELAAWKKYSDSGNFLSLSGKEADGEKNEKPAAKKQAKKPADDLAF
jgi:hypothetical protein